MPNFTQPETTIKRAILSSVRSALIFFAGLVAAIFAASVAIEHRVAIWRGILFTFSLGGHYWGAVAVAAVCMVCVVFSYALASHIEKLNITDKARLWFWLARLISIAAWVVADCALRDVVDRDPLPSGSSLTFIVGWVVHAAFIPLFIEIAGIYKDVFRPSRNAPNTYIR